MNVVVTITSQWFNEARQNNVTILAAFSILSLICVRFRQCPILYTSDDFDISFKEYFVKQELAVSWV